MTTRYSGNVVVHISWLDSQDQYKATVDGAEHDGSSVVVHRKKPTYAPKAPWGFTKAR